MSYAADEGALWRRAAAYVDKIFKGAKPADLPVEQPTRFELLVNLKAAEAIGITFPPEILELADEVDHDMDTHEMAIRISKVSLS
jgi:putative ABC transport system substrate-binding protein